MKKVFLVLVLISIINSSYSQNFKDFINSGIIKDSLQDYAGAIEDYDYAIRLNSTCPACYLLRENSNNKIENYQGAIYDLTVILNEYNADSNYNHLYLERGRNYFFLQDYENAIADMDIYFPTGIKCPPLQAAILINPKLSFGFPFLFTMAERFM